VLGPGQEVQPQVLKMFHNDISTEFKKLIVESVKGAKKQEAVMPVPIRAGHDL
jgi:hypothetical protein